MIAGADLFNNFLKIHSTLAIRKPETTSLARTSAFNKHNSDLFDHNYERSLFRENISPNCVWNMYETGQTTVSPSAKIIGRKGQK